MIHEDTSLNKNYSLKLRKGGYHLKAYVSVAGPDLIAIGSSEAAKDILRVKIIHLYY